MEAIAIVTILAALQVFWFAFQVGSARVKSGVKAPDCTGAPEFERANRVHQNTVEQYVLVIPAMWIFGFYVHELIAAGFGLVFIVARLIYRGAYLKDPAGRSAGFGIGALAFAVLAIGGLIGAAMKMLNM